MPLDTETSSRIWLQVGLSKLIGSFIWPQGYETFFMLIQIEHEIYHAQKC